MLTILRVSLVVCACALLSACPTSSQGADPNAPRSPGADAPAAERAVHLFEVLAYDLNVAGSGCESVAETLSKFNQRHLDDYSSLAVEARQTELSPEARADYDTRLRRALEGILSKVDACSGHPGAQRAFTEFDVLVDPR